MIIRTDKTKYGHYMIEVNILRVYFNNIYKNTYVCIKE